MQHPEPPPKISFAIPVRNGIKEIGQTLDSILAQDFANYEVVVCDNASDDGTQELLKSYAAKDSRIKLTLNPANIGQYANFNLAFSLCRGDYMRLIGMEDTIDPTYASTCAAVLDNRPDIISVSAFTRYIDNAGQVSYTEYQGERLESPKPQRRFARALWFLLEDYRYFDTMYNLTRRSAMNQTQYMRTVPVPDETLALQLALLGTFEHVHQCLSTRYRDPAYYDNKRKLALQYNPKNPDIMHASPLRMGMHFASLPWEMPNLTLWQKLACTWAVLPYAFKRARRELYRSLRAKVPTRVKQMIRGSRGPDGFSEPA